MFWEFYAKQYFRWRKVKVNRPELVNFVGNTLFDIEEGANVEFHGKVTCYSCAYSSIDNLKHSKICVRKGASFIVGHNSGWTNTIIHCHESITIGEHVNIGAGCMIFDTNFHSSDWKEREDRSTERMNALTAPVVIGDHVFIGARSMVCKGVTIGARSMIGAGSVVVKDIPADCIAGGNPCKVIKYLKK